MCEKMSCFNHPRADCKGGQNLQAKKTYDFKSKNKYVFFEKLIVLDNPSLMIGSVVEFCLGFGDGKNIF